MSQDVTPGLILKPCSSPLTTQTDESESVSPTDQSGQSSASPSPSSSLAPPNPGWGSPRVKWRHLEGDDLSAACAQGPNDLMAHGVCGAPVEKTELEPPTLVALAPLPWTRELLGPSAWQPRGKSSLTAGPPWPEAESVGPYL